MSNPIDRTLALYDDLVVIARCLETIEEVGASMKLMDESELLKARDESDAAWADVQHTSSRLQRMGVTP